MKTRSVKVALDLPASEAALLESLDDLRAVHPALREAESRAADLERRLAEAKAAVLDRQRAADTIAAGVTTGRHVPADLSAATVAARSAAALVPPLEAQLAEAREAVTRETARAREAVTAEGRRRLRVLARAYRALVVTLDDLETLEAALALRVDALCRDAQGLRDARYGLPDLLGPVPRHVLAAWRKLLEEEGLGQ